MSRRPETPARAPMVRAPMACTDLLERLEAHVDGDLAAAEVAEVEAHLEDCPACTAEYRLAAVVRRELRALPELAAPPAILSEITREVERARFRGPRRMARRGVRPVPGHRRPVWASLAAALFAAVVVAASLWRGPLTLPGELTATADPAVVARATEEARYALAYLTRVNRRAGLKLRDDLFVDRLARPSADSLSRSLSPRLGKTHAVEHDGRTGDNGS